VGSILEGTGKMNPPPVASFSANRKQCKNGILFFVIWEKKNVNMTLLVTVGNFQNGKRKKCQYCIRLTFFFPKPKKDIDIFFFS